MALIKCSKCGKEISDKASSCVHCGVELKKNNNMKCPECGKELHDDKCLNCGYLKKEEDIIKKDIDEFAEENHKTDKKSFTVENKKQNTVLNIVYLISSIFIITIIILNIVVNLGSNTNSEDSNNRKIDGCYYISDSLTGKIDTSISLCIYDKSVTFNYRGDSTTMYAYWNGERELNIRNNYNEIIFYCDGDAENDNNMKCSSRSKVLGTGTWIWKKQ